MWMVLRILLSPMPWRIASTYSAMRSPACSPTMVTPRIRSEPAAVAAIGDGPIEIVQSVARHLDYHALRFRLRLVQPHPRDFRIGEGRPGNHGVISLEALVATEQGVDRGIPCLVRGGMGKLVGTGDVAACKNIRI